MGRIGHSFQTDFNAVLRFFFSSVVAIALFFLNAEYRLAVFFGNRLQLFLNGCVNNTEEEYDLLKM